MRARTGRDTTIVASLSNLLRSLDCFRTSSKALQYADLELCRFHLERRRASGGRRGLQPC